MSRAPFMWLPERRELWTWRVAKGKTTQRGPKASLTVLELLGALHSPGVLRGPRVISLLGRD